MSAQAKFRSLDPMSIITLTATLLMGMIDAYTFLAKDQTFATAQTGNIVELGIKLLKGNLRESLQHLSSIIGYLVGAFVGYGISLKIVADDQKRYKIFFAK